MGTDVVLMSVIRAITDAALTSEEEEEEEENSPPLEVTNRRFGHRISITITTLPRSSHDLLNSPFKAKLLAEFPVL